MSIIAHKYIRIYIHVCPELIEETGRPTGVIWAHMVFRCISDKFESGKKIHTLTDLRRNVTFSEFRKFTLLATAQPI